MVRNLLFANDGSPLRLSRGFADVPREFEQDDILEDFFQVGQEDLSLWLGDVPLYERGVPVPFDADAASAYLKRERKVLMRLRFTLGTGRCTFWTSDLTYEYVKLNAEYTT